MGKEFAGSQSRLVIGIEERANLDVLTGPPGEPKCVRAPICNQLNTKQTIQPE
jgi:hypothetical protein